MQLRQPLEERLEQHFELEPRERRAEAEVRAGAEGEVPVRRAADVELVRPGEGARVAVRGAVEQADPVAPREPDPLISMSSST